MLGKGTFIIRRGSAKRPPPRAIDIFSNYDTTRDGLSESEPDIDSESEPAKYYNLNMRNDTYPCEIVKETNTRHSLNIGKPLSPRERLSLNLESYHSNSSLKRDLSPKQHLSKSNIESKYS